MNLFFLLYHAMFSLMEEAVQLGDCRGNGLVAAFDERRSAENRRVARVEAMWGPRGWFSKIASAFPHVNGAGKRREFVAKHALSTGWARRMYLADGARISCLAGKVWITLDGGGEDIVMAARESRSFGPGTCVLLEALAPSRISLEAL